MIQDRFDEMIGLISQYKKMFPFLNDLLRVYNSSVLVFSYFNKPSLATRKQNVIGTYQIRSILEEHRKKYSSVSSGLLDRLRHTEHDHICISIFKVGEVVYTIFTDFERTDLIGAFFTSEEPKEPPVYSHLFLNGKLISRER